MQFVLYTEMTVAQCSRAINDRLQAKPTKTRHAVDGWVEKGGRFSIAVTLPVFARIKRTTRLKGHMKRESGQTVIRGYVPDGVDPQWQRILAALLVAVVALITLSGQLVLGLAILGGSVLAFVPMAGDWKNSDILLIELEKTCKASPRPKKKK